MNMLKVVTITVAMFLVAGTTVISAQTPTHATTARYFRLNTHPQDAGKPIDLSGRRPNWRKEIGVVLKKDSGVIELRGANGSISSGILPAGVLVMVDEETRVALWVAVCGNEVVTTGWRPEGKIVSYPEAYEKSCDEMQLVLAKLDKLQEGMNILLARPLPPAPLTEAQTRTIIREEWSSRLPAPDSSKDKKMSTGTKVLIGVGVAAVGGLIASLLQNKDKGKGDTISGKGDAIPKMAPLGGFTAVQGHPTIRERRWTLSYGVKF